MINIYREPMCTFEPRMSYLLILWSGFKQTYNPHDFENELNLKISLFLLIKHCNPQLLSCNYITSITNINTSSIPESWYRSVLYSFHNDDKFQWNYVVETEGIRFLLWRENGSLLGKNHSTMTVIFSGAILCFCFSAFSRPDWN